MNNEEISNEKLEAYLAHFQPSVSKTLQDNIFKRKYPYVSIITTVAAVLLISIVLVYSLLPYQKDFSDIDNNNLVNNDFQVHKTSLAYLRFKLNKNQNISDIFSETDKTYTTSQKSISIISMRKKN